MVIAFTNFAGAENSLSEAVKYVDLTELIKYVIIGTAHWNSNPSLSLYTEEDWRQLAR